MPSVDLFLQFVAALQQRAVAGRQVVHDVGEACPERVGIHARAGDDLACNEIGQFARDAQARDIQAIGHA